MNNYDLDFLKQLKENVLYEDDESYEAICKLSDGKITRKDGSKFRSTVKKAIERYSYNLIRNRTLNREDGDLYVKALNKGYKDYLAYELISEKKILFEDGDLFIEAIKDIIKNFLNPKSFNDIDSYQILDLLKEKIVISEHGKIFDDLVEVVAENKRTTIWDKIKLLIGKFIIREHHSFNKLLNEIIKREPEFYKSLITEKIITYKDSDLFIRLINNLLEGFYSYSRELLLSKALTFNNTKNLFFKAIDKVIEQDRTGCELILKEKIVIPEYKDYFYRLIDKINDYSLIYDLMKKKVIPRNLEFVKRLSSSTKYIYKLLYEKVITYKENEKAFKFLIEKIIKQNNLNEIFKLLENKLINSNNGDIFWQLVKLIIEDNMGKTIIDTMVSNGTIDLNNNKDKLHNIINFIILNNYDFYVHNIKLKELTFKIIKELLQNNKIDKNKYENIEYALKYDKNINMTDEEVYYNKNIKDEKIPTFTEPILNILHEINPKIIDKEKNIYQFVKDNYSKIQKQLYLNPLFKQIGRRNYRKTVNNLFAYDKYLEKITTIKALGRKKNKPKKYNDLIALLNNENENLKSVLLSDEYKSKKQEIMKIIHPMMLSSFIYFIINRFKNNNKIDKTLTIEQLKEICDKKLSDLGQYHQIAGDVKVTTIQIKKFITNLEPQDSYRFQILTRKPIPKELVRQAAIGQDEIFGHFPEYKGIVKSWIRLVNMNQGVLLIEIQSDLKQPNRDFNLELVFKLCLLLKRKKIKEKKLDVEHQNVGFEFLGGDPDDQTNYELVKRKGIRERGKKFQRLKKKGLLFIPSDEIVESNTGKEHKKVYDETFKGIADKIIKVRDFVINEPNFKFNSRYYNYDLYAISIDNFIQKYKYLEHVAEEYNYDFSRVKKI